MLWNGPKFKDTRAWGDRYTMGRWEWNPYELVVAAVFLRLTSTWRLRFDFCYFFLNTAMASRDTVARCLSWKGRLRALLRTARLMPRIRVALWQTSAGEERRAKLTGAANGNCRT